MVMRAVFLDRDGTINEEMGYINHSERLIILPKVPEALRLLKMHGFKIILITNQSGAAKGYFPLDFIEEINNLLQKKLKEYNVSLDAIYYCPHHPQAVVPALKKDCFCRKPKPGLIKRAQKDFGLELKNCYVIGDRFVDIELAYNVGAKGILVMTGYGKGELKFIAPNHPLKPHFIAKDLLEAATWIIKDANLDD
ncbi:MAG TPA: HAD family hydrolase [Candidatus Desulfofervidus auxilii]|uniref:D,D-heptose 1,7-bisphosphate phosphatase n=1 Tax=Desulfofervidus auxilii TaxID=1621989 RepID=A0A7V0I9Z2_DESA2|nr:HAD family hydrolase [Candidatus Desulfofervidus auxilii]